MLPDTLVQIAEPFSPRSYTGVPMPAQIHWGVTALPSVWAAGFIAIAFTRYRRWRGVRATLRGGTPVKLPIPVPALIIPIVNEPAVVGCLRPVLVLPPLLLERLSPGQLAAILAHELSHVRRRDNFFAAIHMAVEAIFWFHPFVWWIGSRMFEERELACDEEVLRLGCEPAEYVRGILMVCQHYSEAPLPCVSGVAGAGIKRRLKTIMADNTVRPLGPGRKCLLFAVAVAAIAGPILLGLVTPTHAQTIVSAPRRLVFDVASIKPSKNSANGNVVDIAQGGQRFTATNAPLRLLIMMAYDVNVRQISGGPGWLNSDCYDIEAKPERPASREQIRLMLQSLLADRFNLKLHKETRELPMYVLTAENYQSHLHENKAGGEPHIRRGRNGQTVFENAPIFQLTWFLSLRLRREVLDKTGLKGNYDFELAWIPDVPGRGDGADNPAPDPTGPSVFAALHEQLGLRLTATKGPLGILVIDHADKPSAN
jgi:uncharacterized protein (TIGR03435 family)